MLTTSQTIGPRPAPWMVPPATNIMPRPIEWNDGARSEPRPTTLRLGRGDEIVAQDAPAAYCYMIVSGCARTVKLMPDGRRQIGEFLLQGDIFGWEALGKHEFGAEAVGAVTLHRFRRDGFEPFTGLGLDFARQLHELAARQVRSGREHMVLLGRKNATERITSFLLEISERLKPAGRGRIVLPMCRTDMADYLGLTMETVCRQLALLRQRGTIAIERAKVVIYDRAPLAAALHEPLGQGANVGWVGDRMRRDIQ